MIPRHVGPALRIAMLSEHGQRPSDAILPGVRRMGLELDIDAPPDHCGDGDPLLPRAPFDLTMLSRLELYLDTHHDGTSIPSCRRSRVRAS